MITVMRGGEEVKISKRAGSYVTLRDLIEWTSCDAVRFFLISRKSDTEFVFDIDLALKRNDENPVFYVQYAHARICSVLALWQAEHGAQALDGQRRRAGPAGRAHRNRADAHAGRVTPRCWRAPPTNLRRTTWRSTCATWRRAFTRTMRPSVFWSTTPRWRARAWRLLTATRAGAAQRLGGARRLGAASRVRRIEESRRTAAEAIPGRHERRAA